MEVKKSDLHTTCGEMNIFFIIVLYIYIIITKLSTRFELRKLNYFIEMFSETFIMGNFTFIDTSICSNAKNVFF